MIKLNKFNKNCDLFEQKNKIMTDLTKLDKNYNQKGILTFLININLFCILSIHY